MVQKITQKNFEKIVTRPYQGNCKGTPARNGKAEDGHASCRWCEGNYYVGGECNFGGRHNLGDDLKQINKNFEVFDVLASQQRNLNKSTNEGEFAAKKKQLVDNFQLLRESCKDGGKKFFYGGCVGIVQDKAHFREFIKDKLKDLAKEVQKYIEKVEKATFQDLQNFQILWEKIGNLGKEITKLAAEAKQETDSAKKRQLLLLIKQKQTEQGNLQQQIRNNSGYALFSVETGDNLNDIIRKIIDPNPRNRQIILPEVNNYGKNNKNKLNQSNAWISPEKKEILKTVGTISLFSGGLIITYWWVKSKLEK